MKILDLVQGSDEWLEARLKLLCASEAPAMMGDSKFMSRNQLLDLKKGWQKNPDSSFKKKLFEKGHAHEEMARKFVEMDYCEDFPPVVGYLNYGGLDLLSSFDGISEDGFIFEHKDWNSTLAENVRNAVLEPHYYWQLEHQMLVAQENRVLFVCSDGTEENKVSMIYDTVEERRNSLLAGWAQFVSDLESHTLDAKVESVTVSKNTMPSIICTVNNGEITTNISACLSQIRDLAEIEINRKLETDQDFANKDQQNKDVKALREKLKDKVEQVRGEFVTYSEFETIAKELDGVLQKMQSDGERKVKTEKDAKKKKIVDTASLELSNFVCEESEKLSPFDVVSVGGAPSPDWAAAVKNKRTIESIESSVSEELAKWKVSINQVVEACIPNIVFLLDRASGHEFLFNDAPKLLNQSEEAFKAIVESRIATHDKEKAEKLELQREEIRKEEAEKLKKEEREKLVSSWREMANYAKAQLTSNEIEDVVRRFSEQFHEYQGDPDFMKYANQAGDRLAHLLELEKSPKVKSSPVIKTVSKDDHALDCKGCPDCLPVGDDATNEACRIELEESGHVIDPEANRLKRQAMHSLSLAESHLHEWASNLPVGQERIKAFAIYEAVRLSPLAE